MDELTGFEKTSKYISGWADLGSLLLAVLSYLVGRLDPKSPIWGLSTIRACGIIVVFTMSLAWSCFRFITEGIYHESGPREFLAVSLIYIARWCYLYARLRLPNSKEAKLYKVARTLRMVKMLRLGGSEHPLRKGKTELVLREGVAKTRPLNPPKHEAYWRGVTLDEAKTRTYPGDKELVYLKLEEEHLHSGHLDTFGTVEYLNPTKERIERDAYKHFYDVVMDALTRYAPEQSDDRNSWSDPTQNDFPRAYVQSNGKPKIDVDFSEFIHGKKPWGGLPVEALASRAQADDPRMIGRVARKIAADATYYVTNKNAEFRTAEQVADLNKCLEDAYEHIKTHGIDPSPPPAPTTPTNAPPPPSGAVPPQSITP